MSGFEALGIAYNVMQVIETAGKIISTCKAFHDGRATGIDELRMEATRMSNASKEIQRQNQTPKSSASAELFTIARECVGISLKLQKLVSDLSATSSKNHWWCSFKGTLKFQWRKGKIDEIEKTLERHKTAMNTRILVDPNMRNEARDLIQSSQFDNMSKGVQYFATQCAGNFVTVSKLIEFQHEHTQDHSTTATEKTNDAINAPVTRESDKLGSNNVSQPQRDRFLDSLTFSLMNARYNRIEKSHEKTWMRVFNQSRTEENDSGIELHREKDDAERAWSDFVSWLESSETQEPYWISGKPGSGKSTLFKFLIEHEETLAALRAWNSDTIILKHFFWRIGEQMQSNLKGLLCSLLYQLAMQDDQLTSQLLSQDRKFLLKYSDADWSTDELEETFFTALRAYPKPICFFIDGLDEVTGPQATEGLLAILGKLLRLNRVKVCVSSRPEHRFEARLSECLRLKLHELTRSDMEEYVIARLDELRPMNDLSEHLQHRIISTLLDKAGGVFLWLSLAISSLQDSLQNAEEDKILQRLELLPDTLEKLYEDMWIRLNEGKTVHREKAARYLNMVLLWGTWSDLPFALTPLQIAAADDDGIQAMLLDLEQPIAESQKDEIKQSCDKVTRDIIAKCAGLLQVYPQGNEHNVGFIHRTAVDFLMDKESGIRIRKWDTANPQELRLSLLKGYLSRVRYEDAAGDSDDPWLGQDVNYFLTALARCFEADESQPPKEDARSMLQTSWGMFERGIFFSNDNPRSCFLALVALYPKLCWFCVEATEKEGTEVESQILWDLFSLENKNYITGQRLIDLPFNSTPIVQMLPSHGAKLGEQVSASWRHRRNGAPSWPDFSEAIQSQLLNDSERGHSPMVKRSSQRYNHERNCDCAFANFSSPLEHSIISILGALVMGKKFLFEEKALKFILNGIKRSPAACGQHTSVFLTSEGKILGIDEFQCQSMEKSNEIDVLVLEVNLTTLIHFLCRKIELRGNSMGDNQDLETIRALSSQSAPPFSSLRYWAQYSESTGFKSWLRPLDDQSEQKTVGNGRFRRQPLQPAIADKDISQFSHLEQLGIADTPRTWRSIYSSGLTVLAQERLGMCFMEDSQPTGGFIG